MRFHTLPGSKRYPDADGEYAEILRRHRCLLQELVAEAGPPDRRLLVVTCSWSGGALSTPRSAPVAAASPGAPYWQSLLTDDSEPASQIWTHLYVESFHLDDPRLDQLLRLVADDCTAGVLITAADFAWMYAPHDGGADVHTISPQHRDTLQAAHRDWLSPHPSGL